MERIGYSKEQGMTYKRLYFLNKRTRSSMMIIITRELKMLDRNIRRKKNLQYRIKKVKK